MVTFLTMKEAAVLTGKSPSSIRRLIYPIVEDDKHSDRKQIRPTVDEVVKLRMKGENFPWRISEEFLRREVTMVENSTKPGSSSHGATATVGSEALIDMLRKELDIKNHQIMQQSENLTKQIELISGLSERLREGNILIGSLQKQLGDGSSRARSEAVDVESANEMRQGTGGSQSPDSVMKATSVEVKDSSEKNATEKGTEKSTKTHWLFRKIF